MYKPEKDYTLGKFILEMKRRQGGQQKQLQSTSESLLSRGYICNVCPERGGTGKVTGSFKECKQEKGASLALFKSNTIILQLL